MDVKICIETDEPFWVRLFSRLHWLLSVGRESRISQRFSAYQPHVVIYCNTPSQARTTMAEFAQVCADFFASRPNVDSAVSYIVGGRVEHVIEGKKQGA